MHFLAEGRNDRIQRWIAEQVQSRKSQESDTQSSARESNDSKPSFEGKKEDGVYWQMEDLEREMALTAYAFGRKNWPISASSIDTSILNLGDLKKLSELIVHEKKEKPAVVPDLQHPDIIVEEPPSPTTPERVHDKRRDARIVSQPPELPPTPQIFDLPSPIIHRAAPVPPPIETTPRTSDVPPIAFIFQETSSPVSSSIHFTPALPESLEAFPSTPRSFTSFIRPSIDGHVKFQELFLSPRLVTPRTAGVVKTPNVASQEPIVAVTSPMTPHSIYSDSCLSTPSLSAFPPTPASTFPSKLLKLPFMSTRGETETKIPPVPEIPPSEPFDTDPTYANTNKSLPSSPIPIAEISSESSPNDIQTITTRPTVAKYVVESPIEHIQDNTEVLSDSASDILSGRLSSRFSLFSSKFSISSLDDLDQNETKGKWSSTVGKASSRSRSRAASVSTNHTGRSKKNVFKSKSSSASLHSRAGSRNETRSPAHITQGAEKTHSRNTSSKTGSRSGSLAAQDLSSSLSSLGLLSTNNEDPMESRMITHHIHTRADSVPTPPPPPSVPVSVGNGFSPSVSESPSHRTAVGNGRGRNTLMSRITLGMGLRRSRSSGSSGSRPKQHHPRNKTHATTLSGSNVNVSEHVYFNTSDGISNHTATTATTATATTSFVPLLNDTHSAVIPSSSSSSLSSPASMMLHSSAPSYSQTTNPPVPSKPPRLTLTTQFGSSKSTTTTSTTSTSMIRYPLTPKTPASSISSSFLTGGGGGESASAEPLPTINWRECLILRGVNRDNKYDEPVIRWCEQLGEIDDILRIRGSGTIVVYFKEEGIMKKNRGVFDPREVNIAGVGIVTINWSRTMVPPEKKPSA